MILKGSQRGGAQQLGLHLLKTTENEHVEIHDVRGFMANDVISALREAEAISKGTKCKQFLFSVSLNPPETESVRIETFEKAIASIEEKHGLAGQPRVVVFHEKEGRRHCHAVWSRIDAETMTAKPLSFFKNKLREVSRQLYLENGWQMPRGLANAKDRDPRNFSLAEWQQAKRIGRHAGDLKADIQEAWAISDNRKSFSHALEERGLYLARGDRRGHVAVTFEGEVISIPRAIGKKSREITTRLGKSQELASVNDTRARIAKAILPKIAAHVSKANSEFQTRKAKLDERRHAMQAQHQEERAKLDVNQTARVGAEVRARSARFRNGLRGLLDRVTGKRTALEKQNQMEAIWSLQRDREQRQSLVDAQLKDRQTLQSEIRSSRNKHAEALRALHFDRTNYRLMLRELEPLAKRALSPLKSLAKAAGEIDLSAKPIADLGKIRLKTLSRAFSKPPREILQLPPVTLSQPRNLKKAPEPSAKTALPVRNDDAEANKRTVPLHKTEKPKVSSSTKESSAERHKKISASQVISAQERLEKLRKDQQSKPTQKLHMPERRALSPEDRLKRLRDDQIRKPRGPELDR